MPGDHAGGPGRFRPGLGQQLLMTLKILAVFAGIFGALRLVESFVAP